MLSIPSHQYSDSPDSYSDSPDNVADRASTHGKDLKAQLGDQLDELAVFAFVAVAVLYIAAASYGLFF